MNKLNLALQENERLRDIIEDDTLSKNETHVSIKRQSIVGRRGRGSRWPVWIVQLICELLVVGAPPSVIPGIILTTSTAMTHEEPESLPSISFFREC